MRCLALILMLSSIGCVSDGYDSDARYYDNGVGYSDTEWRYEQQHSGLHGGAGYYYYESAWPYQSRQPRTRIDYHRSDSSYRDQNDDRQRDRDQQRDELRYRGVRYPADRVIQRNDRPTDRIAPPDHSRDAARDVERNREREVERDRQRTRDQQNNEPREIRRPEPSRDTKADPSKDLPKPPTSPERVAPRGDRNVRDAEAARSAEPQRPSRSGSEESADRVRRR